MWAPANAAGPALGRSDPFGEPHELRHTLVRADPEGLGVGDVETCWAKGREREQDKGSSHLPRKAATAMKGVVSHAD
jgi:hypothetical protein